MNYLVISFGHIIILLVLIYIFDKYKINVYFCGRDKPRSNQVNSYVEEQKEKAKNSENTVRINNISKTYNSCCGDNVRAVDNFYLGIEPNEKFGLLGFNGGGKSTTFKSITNEINTDSGSIDLFGWNLEKDFEIIRNLIGYCPQTNAFLELLTVEENLNFFLSNKACINMDFILENYHLTKFKKTLAKNLSGGNKRKLNFAIAMVNKRRLILLDEPSTGVDPEARRTMWKNINNLNNYKTTYNMILTTHSIEEAEILCDTIGWMKNGNFVIVGNPEKLKFQTSKGYYLEFKIYRKNEDNNLEYEEENSYLTEIKGYKEVLSSLGYQEKAYVQKDLNFVLKNILSLTSKIELLSIFNHQVKLLINFDCKNQAELFDYIIRLNVSKQFY